MTGVHIIKQGVEGQDRGEGCESFTIGSKENMVERFLLGSVPAADEDAREMFAFFSFHVPECLISSGVRSPGLIVKHIIALHMVAFGREGK